MNWFTSIFEPIINIVKEPINEWQKRKTLEVEIKDKDKERQHELNLKKIDIVQLLEKKEENEIKFSNYISYHQEEYYNNKPLFRKKMQLKYYFCTNFAPPPMQATKL